jgi:gas vesicle protein
MQMSSSTQTIKDIGDLYEVDIDFIVSHLNDDKSGYWSRSLIKTVVSFYEAQVYTLKNELIDYCCENSISISPEVLMFLKNLKYEIKDNGNIREKYFQTTLKAEIKFIFNEICNLQKFELKFDYGDVRWAQLLKTIEVRNRLTHPKELAEQRVTDIEIEDCVVSLVWFYDNTTHFMKQHGQNLQRKVVKLNEQVQNYECKHSKKIGKLT